MYTQLATVFRSFDAVICPTIGSSGLLADQEYPEVGKLDALTVAGHGYRWIRLRRGR